MIPGRKIVWLVTESTLNWLENDEHEWENTRMIFEISTQGDKTVLHFTHEGLVPEKESHTKCEQGWNMVIKDWLFNFITNGELKILAYQNKKKNFNRNISASISASEAIKKISKVPEWWGVTFGRYPFDYTFLSSQFDALYKTDIHVGQLFTCFAVVAFLISCLGLFGLVTFTAESKVKEIGVRKVLGASAPNLVVLMSKDFLLLVLIAAAIAFPVAWYSLNNFLQGYAYRTNLSWWVFALSGLATLLIAMFTVGFKCVQASLANPIKALKNV